MSTDLTSTEADWQRLDPKMLLVHPIREVFRFLPVLAGVFIAGSQAGGEGPPYELIGVAVPVLLGVARYYTTRYRIADGRIELRRGLLSKHVLTAQLDRVRTVDLTASPIHRVLSLTTVKIGTGTASTSGEDQLDLDGLPTARAHQLRYDLLHAVGSAHPGNGLEEPVAPDGSSQALVARTVARLDPSWARFAPLTSSGLVMFAAIAGVGSQVLDGVGFFDSGHDIPGLAAALWIVVSLVVVLGLITVSTLAVVGYLITNWDYSLTHTSTDGSWHLRRGLFTTRETSIDDGRVRGVAISEPVGLRLLGGARLSAVATGLGRESGNTLLVPPAPREVVDRAAIEVIGTPAPVVAPLQPHGPAAVRRRWTRALALPVLATVGAVALAVFDHDDVPAWFALVPLPGIVVGAALARDRARALGHDLVDGFLVVRSGSLVRSRDVLELDGIIGWNLRSSFFQRRAGLTTLVATTAGGSQSYAALDCPEDRAVTVAAAAHPELLAPFLTDYRTRPEGPP